MILQTGFSWDVTDGQTQYAAWYEWYPQNSYDFDITINEGDSISMSVVATSATSGTAYITNESTGQSVQQQFNNQQALCYDCKSCKAGVLANIKKEWRLLAVVDAGILILVILVYSIGCCALRNNRSSRYSRHKAYP